MIDVINSKYSKEILIGYHLQGFPINSRRNIKRLYNLILSLMLIDLIKIKNNFIKLEDLKND